MTGIEALQALREGKKVTHPEYAPDYYVFAVEYISGGKKHRQFAAVGAWDKGPISPTFWCGGDAVNASDFLRDDWELWDDALQEIEDAKQFEKHTWNEWKKLGYHVIKGQKAESFNTAGEALFTRLQVAVTLRQLRPYRKSRGVYIFGVTPNRHSGSSSYDYDGRPEHGGMGEDYDCMVNGDCD